ncbi:MAG: hypothetical protein EOM50_21885 [Erysipelotrichia bacterium]|nr:hypothetical protein [Erysipelotrichia bacterium]
MEKFDLELSFTLQEKSVDSVPDATITQDSFKVVVETKMFDWFYADQLKRHLEAFGNETHKVLITLAPELMEAKKKEEFDKQLKQYNDDKALVILHVNTTFKQLADAVADVIDENDYEMQNVLEDYNEYCSNDGLIPNIDAWKYMRMQLAGTTFQFNVKTGLYYDSYERGFRPHEYLGLYTQKSIRAIGKIVDIITAQKNDGKMEYKVEKGQLTEEKKNKILAAIEDGKKYGYTLTTNHRYFFVDKFYETDFNKSTSRPPMGSRIFDLTQVLKTDKLTDTMQIAEKLKLKSWN